MDLLFETDKLCEFADGSNRSFCLKDSSTFSITDYRVMQGYRQGGLVRCEKVIYNGKIKLMYFTGRLKRLSEVVPFINESSFFQLISDFLGNLLRISENGFFECGSLLLDSEHIMVDESRMKNLLIYLPFEHPPTSNETYGERAKGILAKTAQAGMMLSEKNRSDFMRMLSETDFSLESLYEKINSRWMTEACLETQIKEPEVPETKKEIMVLTPMNESGQKAFRISMRDFVIGRREGYVDGLIPGHKLVSRSHCRILYKTCGCFVEDLNSKNGTFVNGEKVLPENPARLEQGMLLRVADVSFRVDYVNG